MSGEPRSTPGAGGDRAPAEAAGGAGWEPPGPSLARWRRQPLVVHLLACALLLTFAAVRFWPQVASPQPLSDEEAYLQAFRNTLEGRSPYLGTGYYYPPGFAVVGGLLLGAVGALPVLALLRLANLLGLAFTVWLALAWLPPRWPWRLGVAAAFVGLSPAVSFALTYGNITFAVVALTLASLLGWRQRPLAAGCLMGLGIAVKPVAPASLAALSLHSPTAPSRRHLLAAGAAVAAAGVLLLPGLPHLLEMLRLEGGPLIMKRTFSLYRVAVVLGLPVAPWMVLVAGTAVTGLIAWRRPLSALQLLCLATAGAVVSAPLLWSHTLVLVLPLQTVALSLAVSRRHDGVRFQGALAAVGRYELSFVVLGCAAIQLAEGGAIDHLPGPLQAVLLAVPAAAVTGLAAYVLKAEEPAREPV